jgi:prepilin-type processing-associated H-X9-DG protein
MLNNGEAGGDMRKRVFEYADPTSGEKRSAFFAWRIGLAVMAAVLVVIAVMLPHMNRTYVEDPRVRCESSLRMIGQAILLYTNDSKGVYPNTFGDLLLTQDITSDVFVCLSSNDTPATGPTTQAVIATMNTPGYCSYIYLGKGLTVPVTANTVVVYEPMANHGDGMNVLFGDGHVEFIYSADAAKILDQVKAGVWPVKFPK